MAALVWKRIEPGLYEAHDGLVLYQIVRVSTKPLGFKGTLWEVRVNNSYRPPRRKYLARAKFDVEEFNRRFGPRM